MPSTKTTDCSFNGGGVVSEKAPLREQNRSGDMLKDLRQVPKCQQWNIEPDGFVSLSENVVRYVPLCKLSYGDREREMGLIIIVSFQLTSGLPVRVIHVLLMMLDLLFNS